MRFPAVLLALALAVTACSTESGSPSGPQATTTTAPSADQSLVDQLNTIKSKYPADTSAKVTVATLPVFLTQACRIVKSGAAYGPEWSDIAQFLTQDHKCS